MKKKVSIVVPVYNTEKYIAICIESLINQTYKEIEIIFINDGSTDNSIKILKKYQQKDSRIVIIDRENKGSIYSRVEGMHKATGDYIMFVDADDWLDLETVEKTLKIAEKYETDIVRFYFIREQVEEGIKNKINGPYKEEKYIEKEQFQKYLYPVFLNTYACNSTCGQLIKKEIIKNIKIENDHIKMGDDLLINLEMYKNINSIVFTNNHFYHYRKTENSITSTASLEKLNNNIKDTYEVYSKFYEMIKIWNIDTEENRNLVSKRIIDEMLTILRSVFVNEMNKEQKIEVIKGARNLLSNDIQIDKHSLNKIEKMFLEKEYNDIIRYTTVTIRVPYLIKKQTKRLLKSINKLGGKTK